MNWSDEPSQRKEATEPGDETVLFIVTLLSDPASDRVPDHNLIPIMTPSVIRTARFDQQSQGPTMGTFMTARARSEWEYVALDLETTGLMSETDRIVEIGAVRFAADGREIGRFQRLVNPQRPMSPAAYAIHGLSDADLVDAAPAHEILPEFLLFLGDACTTALIAHNAAFDAGFLGRELGRAGLPAPTHSLFDTLALARRRLPDLASHRLDSLARFFGLDPSGAHRALADSLRVKALWVLSRRALGNLESPRLVSGLRSQGFRADTRRLGTTHEGCGPRPDRADRVRGRHPRRGSALDHTQAFYSARGSHLSRRFLPS